MRLTLFSSVTDPTAPTHEIAWPELVERLNAPAVYPDKFLCPLIKLAVFGNTRNANGMLRHDANVTAVSGIELDYDGELVTIDEAAQRLERAGVRCMLYTSANNKPDAPRWRVLIPLKGEYAPEYRRSLYDAANAIVGGICDPVSATLSQAYFIGAVDNVQYECRAVDGSHLDEIVEAVAKPLDMGADARVPEWRPVNVDALPIDDDTRRLIREGAPKGERSEALMSAANSLARARVHPDDIVRVLADPANGISAKALEGRRQRSAMDWLARHTVRKALEAFPSPEMVFASPTIGGRVIAREPLFVRGGELTAKPKPIDWLIRHIMERPILGVLFGGPGVGKSYMAIDWACCIATGKEWLGHKVTRGAVAYIAGEGYGGMPRRFKAWEIEHGVSLADAPIFVSRRGVAFNDERAFTDLMSELDALPEPPALIIVDTLARATPNMDEDRAKEMSGFVSLCDRLREKYGCSVIVIHHSPHGDSRRAKGSIALKGAIDFEAGMIRTDKDGPVTLFCPKMKEGEPFADMHFAFKRVVLPWPDDDNLPQASAIMVPSEAPEPKTKGPRTFKLADTDHMFLAALGNAPKARDDVRADFIKRYGKTERAGRTAWSRAFNRGLKDRQWFSFDGHTLTPALFAIGRDQRGDGVVTDVTSDVTCNADGH